MNNFCFKFLFLLVSLVSVVTNYAEEFGHNADELLITFENNCVHNKKIEQVKCDELLKQMNEVLASNKVTFEGKDTAHCPGISSSKIIDDLNGLDSVVEDASLKMSCNKKDQKEVAASCHEDLLCNLGRSVASVVDKVAPHFIAKRVKKSLDSTANAMGAGKKCLQSERSNCLTEVVSSFVANIVGTFDTLKDVAKATVKSIWGLKDYLFKKSEDLHEAANSKVSEISLFIKSPGDYIINKFIKAKKAIDDWIKGEVFCQKWKGSPHSGTCIEPLESYSCLNCNDGLNAFCAGAGVFASETFIAFTTAGTLTAANITMKAGVRFGVLSASKAATRIIAEVPALGRLGKVHKRSKMALIARKSAKVSMATLQKISEAMLLYKERIGKMAVTKHFVAMAKGVQHALDIASVPLSHFDDVAEKAMRGVVARGIAKKGNDHLSQFIRSAARYKNMKIMTLIKEGKSVASNTSSLTTARGVRKLWGHRGNDHFSVKKSKSDYSSDWSSNGGEDSQRKKQQPDTSSSLPSQDKKPSPSQDKKSSDRDLGDNDSNSNSNDKKKGGHTYRKGSPLPLARAIRVAVAADLAEKVRRGLSAKDGVNPADLISEQTTSKIIQGDSSSDQISRGDTTVSGQVDQSAIERRTGRKFSSRQQAQDFAQAMHSQYSNQGKRSQLIDSFRKQGYSNANAEKIYNSEKNFYKHSFSASNNSNDIANGVKPIATVLPPSAISTKIGDADKLVNDIKKQIKDLETTIQSGSDPKLPKALAVGGKSTSIAGDSSFTDPNQFRNAPGSVAGSFSAAKLILPPSKGDTVNASPDKTTQDNPTTVKNTKEVKDKSKAKLPTLHKDLKPEEVARIGKLDYLDLYLKLAKVAKVQGDSFELGFSEATKKDAVLVKGLIHINDYLVLNIHVKNKDYKIFKDKKTGMSLAFIVRSDGLDALEDFPKDLI